jgi:hypothetical protein
VKAVRRSPTVEEHEFEPEHGLPARLPANERLLWQGQPDWRVLARRAFHVRKLVVYFGALLLLRGAVSLGGGGPWHEALRSMLMLLPLALLAIGGMALMAWLTARSAVYTITDKRIVMRIGIVLTLTFNLPFKRIASAGVRLHPEGTGDLPLTLTPGDHIGWLNLWPHARPWRLARPEPMLRCVPQAADVAQVLAQAWSCATGQTIGAGDPAVAMARPAPGTQQQPILAGH